MVPLVTLIMRETTNNFWLFTLSFPGVLCRSFGYWQQPIKLREEREKRESYNYYFPSEYETEKRHYAHIEFAPGHKTSSEHDHWCCPNGRRYLVVSAPDGPNTSNTSTFFLRQVNVPAIVVYLNKTDMVSDPEILVELKWSPWSTQQIWVWWNMYLLSRIIAQLSKVMLIPKAILDLMAAVDAYVLIQLLLD